MPKRRAEDGWPSRGHAVRQFVLAVPARLVMAVWPFVSPLRLRMDGALLRGEHRNVNRLSDTRRRLIRPHRHQLKQGIEVQ